MGAHAQLEDRHPLGHQGEVLAAKAGLSLFDHVPELGSDGGDGRVQVGADEVAAAVAMVGITAPPVSGFLYSKKECFFTSL